MHTFDLEKCVSLVKQHGLCVEPKRCYNCGIFLELICHTDFRDKHPHDIVKERYYYAINILLKEGLDDIIFEALL